MFSALALELGTAASKTRLPFMPEALLMNIDDDLVGDVGDTPSALTCAIPWVRPQGCVAGLAS